MFDEVRLLVVKLLVVCAILLKVAKEVDEFRLVLQKNVYDGLRFIRVGHKHLEDMKSLKLNVWTLISQKVHHELQVLWFTDVPRHDCEVVSVQKQFAQQLQ